MGAPGEDDGRGVVYIFLALEKGLTRKKDWSVITWEMCLVPSQILKASQINSNLRGFGISFSRSLDVDNNGYPDFAVGAHKSNQAVLLRSQPIVKYQVKSKDLNIYDI